MFSKNKNIPEIDQEQYHLIKTAEHRIKQKKKLYYHFVIFLIGSVFLIIINKVLKYGEPYNWFIWFITLWAFLFIIHSINVFITNRFLGKKWEQAQREKLVAIQKNRIEKIKLEIEKEFPITETKEKE